MNYWRDELQKAKNPSHQNGTYETVGTAYYEAIRTPRVLAAPGVTEEQQKTGRDILIRHLVQKDLSRVLAFEKKVRSESPRLIAEKDPEGKTQEIQASLDFFDGRELATISGWGEPPHRISCEINSGWEGD